MHLHNYETKHCSKCNNASLRKLIWVTSRPQSEKINHEGNAASVLITTVKTWLHLQLPHLIRLDEMSIRSQAWHMVPQDVPNPQLYSIRVSIGKASALRLTAFSIFRLGGIHSLLSIKVFDQQSCSRKIRCNFIFISIHYWAYCADKQVSSVYRTQSAGELLAPYCAH